MACVISSDTQKLIVFLEIDFGQWEQWLAFSWRVVGAYARCWNLKAHEFSRVRR